MENMNIRLLAVYADRTTVLHEAYDIEVSLAFNGSSALQFTLPNNAEQDVYKSWRLLGEADVVAQFRWDGMTAADPWFEPANAKFVLMEEDADGAAGEGVTYFGTGVHFDLSGLLNHANDVYRNSKTDEHEYKKMTPGMVLRLFCREARDLGVAPKLSFDFSDSKDSAGNDWVAADRFDILNFQPGASAADVLEALEEKVDWQFQGDKLQLFRKGKLGMDRSGDVGDDRSQDVSLAFGREFADLRQKRTMLGAANWVYGVGAEHWTVQPTPQDARRKSTRGARMTSVRFSDAKSYKDVVAAATKFAESQTLPGEDYSRDLVMQTATYLPFRNFHVGDVVAVQDAAGVWGPQQVVGLLFRSDAEGLLVANIQLGSGLASGESRLAKHVAKTSGGSKVQGSGGKIPAAARYVAGRAQAPTSVRGTAMPSTSPEGVTSCSGQVTWVAPTLTVNEMTLLSWEIFGYQLRTRLVRVPMEDGHDWVYRPETARLVQDVEGLLPGRDYELSVRAETKAGWGDWSEPVVLRTPGDVTPPPKPSAPSGESTAGTVTWSWDGKSSSGGVQPLDYAFSTLAWAGMFDGSPVSGVLRMLPGGTLTTGPFDRGSVAVASLTSTDTAGNVSVASEPVSVTVLSVLDDTGLDAELAAAKARVDGLSGTVATLAQDFPDVKADLETLGGTLSDLNDALSQGLGDMGGELAGLREKLDTDLGALNAALDGMNSELSGDLTALQGLLDGLSGELDSLESDLSGQVAVAQAAADQAAQDAIDKAAAAEAAAKTYAEAEAAAAQAAAVAAASTDASDKAAAAQAAAEAAAALDAKQKADAAQAAAEAKAQAAQDAADAAQDAASAADAKAVSAQGRADAAHALAGTAQGAASAAQGKADQAAADLLTLAGKTGRVIRSTSAPTGEDRSANNLWVNTSTGQLHEFNGSAWVVITDSRLTAAQDRADQAHNLATSAESAASNAQALAEAAQTLAGTAKSTADDAQVEAAAARSEAATAQSRADSAYSGASAAQGAADAAAQAAADAAGIGTAAQAAADAAAADAIAKAAAAEQAAKDHADAVAEAERLAAIAAASDDATAKANAAEAAAAATAAADAEAKANAALAAAKLDATSKANAATAVANAAQSAADAAQAAADAAAADAINKAAAAEQAAKDHADAQAAAAEAAAIAAASGDASDKAAAAQAAAVATAAADAADKANAALAAAKLDATSKADAAAAIANAKADVLIQGSAPAAGMRKATTLWIDTTGGNNTPKRWSGSAWVEVTDKAAKDAAAAAVAAQGTADQAVTDAAAAKSAADTAQAAAAGAQARADAAHGLATTADGRITVATANPTAANATGKPIGAIWEVRAGGVALRRYVLTGASTWTQVKVGQDFIGNNAIGSAQIVDAAIGTAQIADAAITNAKIGNLSVDTAKIADAAITNAKIDNLSAEKISAGTLNANRIGGRSITAEKIAANTLTANEIAANTLTANEIAANAITASELAANSVQAGHITTNAVVADKIAANAVIGEKIAARTILGEKLVLGSVSNLIPNGAGEMDGLHGWADRTHINWTPTGGPGNYGAFYWAGSGTPRSNGTQAFDVVPGREYLFEVWLWANKANSRMYLEARNAVDDSWVIDSTSNVDGFPNGGTGSYLINNQVVPTSWTQYRKVITFNAPRVYVDGLYWNHSNGTVTDAQQRIAGMRLVPMAGAELVVDGAIKGRHVEAQSISGDKLVANTITGDKIAANSILAKNLVLTDFSNLFPDPTFEANSSYGTWGTPLVRNNVRGIAKYGTGTQTGTYHPEWQFSTTAGDSFFFEMNIERIVGTTSAVAMYVRQRNAAGTIVRTTAPINTTATGRVTGQLTITDDSVVTLEPGLYTQIGTPTSTRVFVSQIKVHRRTSAELLVDGAVTADSIASNAVTAAKIAAGAVTTAKMTAGSIDADRINAGTYRGQVIAGAKLVSDTTSDPYNNVTIENQTITVNREDEGRSFPTVTIGGSSSDRIELAPTSGSPTVMIDGESGDASFAGELSGEVIRQGGDTLDEILDPRPLGVIGHFWASGAAAGISDWGSSPLGLFKASWDLVPYRRYMVKMLVHIIGTTGHRHRFQLHHTTGSSLPTVTTATEHAAWVYTNGNAQTVYFEFPIVQTYTNAQRYNILISAQNQTTNARGYMVSGTQSHVWVEDQGVPRGVVASMGTSAGGGSPFTGSAPSDTSTSTRSTKTYNATGVKSWNGTTVAGDVLHHGYLEGRQRYSQILFPSTVRTDLSGASIEKVEVYLKNIHTWNRKSMKTRLRAATNTSLATNAVTTAGTEFDWGHGKGQWVTITGWTASSQSIWLGGGAGTNNNAYGKFSRALSDCRLRVTYTK